MSPRVAFNVPNTISGQGQLPVELRFNKMEDFSPAAVANQVEPLRRLLEMRERIASLLTYMDGKVDAERFVSELLQDPKRLSQLAAAAPALAAENRDDSDNNGAAQ
jgi:type VI secretion system protein ImpB